MKLIDIWFENFLNVNNMFELSLPNILLYIFYLSLIEFTIFSSMDMDLYVFA